MYETFENLPESKRKLILQVSMEEFAINGYDKASTNKIVERLNISKGVLFLYFKSKKNLYLYIIDYLFESLIAEFIKRFSEQSRDEAIDIFKHMGEFYNIILRENPYAFIFMLGAFLEAPSELRDEIELRHERSHEKLKRRISIDGLRKDISPQMIIDLVHMVSYYIGRMVLRECKGNIGDMKKNIDKYIDIFDEYLRIIKYGAFEEGYNLK